MESPSFVFLWICFEIRERIRIHRAVIQKHTAAIAESGVITHFSFLLLEIKFMTVLNERYTAITIQIRLVIADENHKGMNPPICKIITTKNSCTISCAAKRSRSFLGKTLYFPPIVSSPSGKPQMMRNDNTIMNEKTLAPRMAIMVDPPPEPIGRCIWI